MKGGAKWLRRCTLSRVINPPKVTVGEKSMSRVSSKEAANFDLFMESIARLLGISRRKLDKMVFPAKIQTGQKERASGDRKTSKSMVR